MQLQKFKQYALDIINEGIRLQKVDINGDRVTKWRYTNLQVITLILSVASLFFLKSGYSVDFAGYVIGFLGLFMGLFTSAIISTFERRDSILKADDSKDKGDELARLRKVKNHLKIFNGLTSYAIFIAIILVLLLSLNLLDPIFNAKIGGFDIDQLDRIVKERNYKVIIKIGVLQIHRFATTFLLLKFFYISTFSLISYFSYLQYEYNRIKIEL
jgi:hypothetical protein